MDDTVEKDGERAIGPPTSEKMQPSWRSMGITRIRILDGKAFRAGSHVSSWKRVEKVGAAPGAEQYFVP